MAPASRFAEKYCARSASIVVQRDTVTALKGHCVAAVTGADLPGIPVLVETVETGDVERVTTDVHGRFVLPQTSGHYYVLVCAPEFAAVVADVVTASSGVNEIIVTLRPDF